MIKNERLKDIGLRHGKDSTSYKNSEKMIDWLKKYKFLNFLFYHWYSLCWMILKYNYLHHMLELT